MFKLDSFGKKSIFSGLVIISCTLVFVCFVGFVYCGGALTRPKAEKIIMAYLKSKPDPYKYLKLHFRDRMNEKALWFLHHQEEERLSDSDYKILNDKGYIKIQEDQKVGELPIFTFEQKSQEYISYYDSFIYNDAYLYYAVLDSVKITGIKNIDDNTKEACYTIIYKPNSIGKLVSVGKNIKIMDETKTLRRYDDGWRVD